MQKATNGPKFHLPKNLILWANINTACKVNNRDVPMLIPCFKLYNKLRYKKKNLWNALRNVLTKM